MKHCYDKFSCIISPLLLLLLVLFVSACDLSGSKDHAPLQSLSLSITTLTNSYSEVGELIEFNYLVTNNGAVNIEGPATVSTSLSQVVVDCPDLTTIGNYDELLQPNESLVCHSLYEVGVDDLKNENVVNVAMVIADSAISNQDSLFVTNIAESLFIFPFNTLDPSVIFRSTLSSSDNILQSGGEEEPGSLNEFDTVLGMKPGAASNGVPGCRFESSSIPSLASIPSGQLSIEVEREWLAKTDAEIGSIGYDHTSIEYLISFGPVDIAEHGRIYMQPDEYLLFHFNPQEDTRRTGYVNTNRSNRFARLTISWIPGEVSMYVDGLFMGKVSRTDIGSDRFSNIHIGSIGGISDNSFKSGYYIRNLIVASKPVKSSSHTLLRHVMQLGDSFSTGLPLFNVPKHYDGTISNTIIRELFSKGIWYDDYTVYSNGGGKIQDNSDDPIEFDVTNGAGKTRGEALSEDPSLIIFITGGNDLSIFQYDQFLDDIRDHIEAFMGVNGYPSTNVQHVIITTTTSRLQATSNNLHDMREIMLALPNWWNNKYPLLKDRVHVVDTWLAFGGVSVDPSLFGINDLIHPSATGNIVYGRAISNEIMRLAY